MRIFVQFSPPLVSGMVGMACTTDEPTASDSGMDSEMLECIDHRPPGLAWSVTVHGMDAAENRSNLVSTTTK